MKKNKLKAFTLVELLVVVTIITILTGVILLGLSSVQKKGQDTKRLGDISQIRLALETYKSIYNRYPDVGTGNDYISGIAPGFIDKLPQDPSGATGLTGYMYEVSDDKKSYCFKIKGTVYNTSSQPDFDVGEANTWTIMRGPDTSICSSL